MKNFVPENYMPPKQVRRMDRFTQFAVASAKMLLQDAGFEVTEANACQMCRADPRASA